ncbi:MAG: heavy-metal-associated domain-containing protein [Actinomycetota bacterium]|nr:heavy-metal-associated domain-containing protein [Actinomycetota bacterium]
MTRTTTFTVTGEQKMHCEGCEQRIDRALRRLPGVRDVEASAESQRVIVEMDPEQVGPEQVRERLDLLGYEVTGGASS